MARIIPQSGTDYARRIAATRGDILDDEIHTTRDQKRVFLGNYLVAPYVHQEVNGEAAMLTLNTTSVRGCFAFDVAVRVDGGSPRAWLCIGGRGATIEQWLQLGSADDGTDALFGGYFADGLLDDTFQGGNFSGYNAEGIHGGFFHDGIHGGFF